ncbi:DUF2842 domain-containing protein [Rhodobacteraceae bacterium LMO-12]|nr:DUF2842 domain-containing protein [Rhodobacteraceae bacterium LMO-JJ12]
MFENLSYKARRRWALLLLVVGMPAYIVICVTVLNRIGPLPGWIELPLYIGLGVIWIVPFKGLFRGIGQPDPDAPGQSDE